MLFSNFSVFIKFNCLAVVFEELYILPAVGQLDFFIKTIISLCQKAYIMFQITVKTYKEN